MDKSARLVRIAVSAAPLGQQPVRQARSKPWIPKFKIMRTIQPFKPTPNVREIYRKFANQLPHQAREQMKREGYLMPPTHLDRTIYMSHTDQAFEAYVPPEGDGKSSLLSKQRATQGIQKITDKTKSFRAERQIRKYDSDFSSSAFVSEALDIYRRAHELLQNFRENDVELLDLVTDHAYSEMTSGLAQKTFRWTYHNSIEPPQAVHTRVAYLFNEDNKFGQVTVRFFSKQTMAIYDRFGRLCYGSPTLAKDVLEYVVFEKHLADEYGRWRLHSKIVPEAAPRRNFYLRTMAVPSKETATEEEPEDDEFRPTVVDEPEEGSVRS